MNDSKLLQLFVTLEKKEMSRLVATWKKKQAYMGVNGPHIYRLFDYLRKYCEQESRLTDEKVFKQVYENRSFKKKDLTLLSSAAHKVLEKYIIDLQLKYEEKENPLQNKIILIRYLKRQVSLAAKEGLPREGLLKRYYRELEKLYEQLQSMPIKEWTDYLDIYMISQMLYNNPAFNATGNGKITLQTLLNSLDQFLYIAKLRHGSEVLVRSRILDEDIHINLMPEIRQIGNSISTKNDRLINIYERYYNLIASDTYQETKFLVLRDYVFESISDIALSEMNTALVLLLNYASWATRYKHYIAPVSYEIYRFGFSNDLFVDEGIIPPQLLINYCFYCTKMGKHYEIPAILNRHLNQVQENRRDTTEILCLTYRDFGLKKYKEIFARFLTPGPNLFPFFFTYRSLKIKCIYKLQEYSAEDGKYYDSRQETTNFINAIKEKNYNDNIKTANINFAKFVAAMDSRKYSRKQLEEMLGGYRIVVYYDWLKAKVDEYQ